MRPANNKSQPSPFCPRFPRVRSALGSGYLSEPTTATFSIIWPALRDYFVERFGLPFFFFFFGLQLSQLRKVDFDFILTARRCRSYLCFMECATFFFHASFVCFLKNVFAFLFVVVEQVGRSPIMKRSVSSSPRETLFLFLFIFFLQFSSAGVVVWKWPESVRSGSTRSGREVGPAGRRRRRLPLLSASFCWDGCRSDSITRRPTSAGAGTAPSQSLALVGP